METAYSTFKRAFGEFCMAKTMRNITKKLTTKAYIYNMLVNLQTEKRKGERQRDKNIKQTN